ncbi:hypothetical protein K0A96_01900, partial [Patescibacteria group bacterium]|nr:hypothetical protein [Patescibacteria group bacterium]
KFTKVAHAIQIPNADIYKMAEEEKGSNLNELKMPNLMNVLSTLGFGLIDLPQKASNLKS